MRRSPANPASRAAKKYNLFSAVTEHWRRSMKRCSDVAPTFMLWWRSILLNLCALARKLVPVCWLENASSVINVPARRRSSKTAKHLASDAFNNWWSWLAQPCRVACGMGSILWWLMRDLIPSSPVDAICFRGIYQSPLTRYISLWARISIICCIVMA